MDRPSFEDIIPGSKIPVDQSCTMTQETIDGWARLANDFNPLHVDIDYAKGSRFGSTVAHGSLTITYILEMLATWLGDVWLSSGQLNGIKYTSPVKPGDIVRPRGQVVEKNLRMAKK